MPQHKTAAEQVGCRSSASRKVGTRSAAEQVIFEDKIKIGCRSTRQ